MARSPERMLEEIAQSRGRSAVLRRKLALNKESNWLLAVMLNSFTKLEQGGRFSDLERRIVDTARANGFGDEQMRLHGRLNQNMPRDLRNEIFSGKFAELNPSMAYSLADLQRDASAITEAI